MPTAAMSPLSIHLGRPSPHVARFGRLGFTSDNIEPVARRRTEDRFGLMAKSSMSGLSDSTQATVHAAVHRHRRCVALVGGPAAGGPPPDELTEGRMLTSALSQLGRGLAQASSSSCCSRVVSWISPATLSGALARISWPVLSTLLVRQCWAAAEAAAASIAPAPLRARSRPGASALG
eukprot:CAMPEP_0170237554 /NCGR_PEP_ID=MMETSP0116_2-20130129/18528_1 /TAXON_ID=400756 /ORGANISM="Durinskia baltica, Strain CSIRO CS-38" /LENGTH=177 /DNA_ID=CAMNT_0010488359 /DNA_START=175 /DNA_END=705 /DNA_ORIENTATION=+